MDYTKSIEQRGRWPLMLQVSKTVFSRGMWWRPGLMKPSEESIHLKVSRGSLLQAALVHMTIGIGFLPWVESRLHEKAYCIGDLWGEGAVNENPVWKYWAVLNALGISSMFCGRKLFFRKLFVKFTVPSMQMCTSDKIWWREKEVLCSARLLGEHKLCITKT